MTENSDEKQILTASGAFSWRNNKLHEILLQTNFEKSTRLFHPSCGNK